MLTVVQNEQRRPCAQVALQDFEQGAAGLLGHAQHGGDRLGHQRRVCQRRQLHEPSAIREVIQHPGGDLQ